MSTKNDYSDAEWKALSTAPVAAGLLITAADASRFFKKAIAVGNAISGSTMGDAPEIVRVLTFQIRARGGTPEMPDLPAGSRSQTRDALISIVQAAVGVLQQKSPAEVESYKTWLAAVTAKVSLESRVGISNTAGRVTGNADEEEALRALAAVLGVDPPVRPRCSSPDHRS